MESIWEKMGVDRMIIRRWLLVSFVALAVAVPSMVAADEGPGTEIPDDGDLIDEDDRPTLEDQDQGPDQLRADEFRDRREFEGQQRQDEAIVQLQRLIDRTPEGDPDRAEYLYNLAEIYWERSRYYEHSAIQQQDECFVLEQEGKEEEARRCQFRKEDMENEAARLRDESIDLSIEIIRNYPHFEELDEVYFELGSNLMEGGEEQEGIEIFRRLLREFPQTEYLPQALLYIGDYHFEEGEMHDALDAYDKVVQYPDAPVYQYARYKMGWTFFNLSRYQEALDEFLEVVDLARAAEEGSADRAMLSQVRTDIVRAYARVGSPHEAIGFFQEIAPEREDWLRLSELLAVYYGDEAQFEDSSQMYRNLIEVNQNSHKVVDYQHEIVRNTATIDSYSEEAVREMGRMFQLVRAADEGQFEHDEELYANEIRNKARDSSRRWANTYHREAQRTRNEMLYLAAHHLYNGYRNTYPDADDLYEMTFYHAELLYELQQWNEAAAAYEEVVEIDPDGEYTEQAVHATVLALFEEVETSEDRAEIEADFDDEEGAEIPEPEEIPELQQRLLTATQNYIEYAPDGDRIVDVKYHRARTFYDYNHLQEAAELFEDIAFNHAGHELADVSANLHLDTLNRLEQFEQLADAVERYIAEQPVDDAEFNEDLHTLNKAIRYNICVVHDEQEEWEEAAHCYIEYVQRFPSSDQADMALYNAALDFERIDEIGIAIQVRRQLLENYPNSELAAETLYNLGGNYHAWAIYSDAANFYEMYVRNFPDEENAEDALANAATFRHGLQHFDQAIDNYELYLDLFGDENPEQAALVFFEVAQIYEEQGRDDDAYDQYRQYIREYGQQGSNDQLLRAHVKIGQHYWNSSRSNARQMALDAFEETLDVYGALSEEEQQQMIDGRDAAAEAKFMIGEDLYEEAEAIRIDSTDDEELQEVTEKKRDAADRAREVYEEVIVFGRPDWAIAALYRIGNGYHDFAETLRDSPIPDGLTPGQEEQYKGLLEDLAMGFEDNAVELYEEALNTARDANWYNEYTEDAEAHLADLRPADYREPSELRAEPTYQHQGFMRAVFIEDVERDDVLEELTDDDDELAGDDEVGPEDVEDDSDQQAAGQDQDKVEPAS